MEIANGSVTIFADAPPTLRALRERGIPTAILTNGPSDGQRRKLAATGLRELVDAVFISEELGFAKPDIRAFEHVLGRMEIDPGGGLMVGDSLEDDVMGALAAGMRAALLSRGDAACDRAHVVVRTLQDVLSLLVEPEGHCSREMS